MPDVLKLLLLLQGKLSKASDVYALGVLIWGEVSVLTARPNKTPPKLIDQAHANPCRQLSGAGTSSCQQNCISSCICCSVE